MSAEPLPGKDPIEYAERMLRWVLLTKYGSEDIKFTDDELTQIIHLLAEGKPLPFEWYNKVVNCLLHCNRKRGPSSLRNVKRNSSIAYTVEAVARAYNLHPTRNAASREKNANMSAAALVAQALKPALSEQRINRIWQEFSVVSGDIGRVSLLTTQTTE